MSRSRRDRGRFVESESDEEFSGVGKDRVGGRNKFLGAESRQSFRERRPRRIFPRPKPRKPHVTPKLLRKFYLSRVKSADEKRRLMLLRGGKDPILRDDRSVEEHDRTLKIPPVQRRLDSMARLMRGEDICCAVCFDSVRKCFLVANNTGRKSKVIKECFKFLRARAKGNYSLESMDKLGKKLRYRLGNIMNYAVEPYRLITRISGLEKILELPTSALKRKAWIKREIEKVKVAMEVSTGNKDALDFKRRFLEESLEDGNDFLEGLLAEWREDLSKQRKEGVEREPRLWDDMEKIIESLAKDAPRDAAFSDDMKAALKRGFEGGGVVFVNKGALHAEMQILEELIDGDGRLKTEQPVYIGVTKLCCRNCIAVVNAFNKLEGHVGREDIGPVVEVIGERGAGTGEDRTLDQMTTREAGAEGEREVVDEVVREERVITRGTHCRLYNSWIKPPFLDRVRGLREKYEEELSLLEGERARAEEAKLSPSPPRRGAGAPIDAEAIGAIPVPPLDDSEDLDAQIRQTPSRSTFWRESGASPEALSPEEGKRGRRRSRSHERRGEADRDSDEGSPSR